ncbi:MAG: restriction endonuclease subunit S [Methanobacterium sp.]
MIKPKLRFPEFNEEWEERKFGTFCSINMGQSPSSKNYTENPNDTILIQGNADLKNGQVVPRIFTKEITKTSEPGNIILTVRAPVGDIATNNYFACIGRGVCSIKGDKFVYYLLDNLRKRNVWGKLSQGSTFEAINSSDIKNLKINIPNPNEQEKIASFLFQVDRKIDLLETNFC